MGSAIFSGLFAKQKTLYYSREKINIQQYKNFWLIVLQSPYNVLKHVSILNIELVFVKKLDNV